METTTWSKLGDLKLGREGHNVIHDGEVFLVVGGNGNLKTEKCSLSGNEFEKTSENYFQAFVRISLSNSLSENTINCVVQEPTLSNYEYFPALFLVPDDYCKEINL